MTMNKLDYTGKNVLIVGGTSGIGSGIARSFRDYGANVHICGSRPALEDYTDQPWHEFSGMQYSQLDLSDTANIDNFATPFKELDVLVLSQGIIHNEREYEIEPFKEVMEINVASVMACCVKFKPVLTPRQGTIILLSSVGAQFATAAAPAYCASKYAVTGLCRILARGWAGEGIRVNAIAPCVVPSKMAEKITENQEFLDAVVASNPMGRLGTAEEIGDAALFLGSQMASYITGQTLVVDGGHTLKDLV